MRDSGRLGIAEALYRDDLGFVDGDGRLALLSDEHLWVAVFVRADGPAWLGVVQKEPDVDVVAVTLDPLRGGRGHEVSCGVENDRLAHGCRPTRY